MHYQSPGSNQSRVNVLVVSSVHPEVCFLWKQLRNVCPPLSILFRKLRVWWFGYVAELWSKLLAVSQPKSYFVSTSSNFPAINSWVSLLLQCTWFHCLPVDRTGATLLEGWNVPVWSSSYGGARKQFPRMQRSLPGVGKVSPGGQAQPCPCL